MKTTQTLDDPAIQALLENLPMSTHTPEHLRNRLAEIASSPLPKHRAIRRPIFAFAFAGALTVAAVAVFMSMPATAKSWSMITKAVQGVKSMRMEIREHKGVRPETTQIAFGPGIVLVQPSSGEIVYVAGSKVQIYDPKENVIREFPMPEGILPDIGKEVMGEISLSKILAEHEREFGKANIKVGAIRLENGRRVYDAILSKPAGSRSDGEEEVRVVADAETDLPIAIDSYDRVGGQLKKVTEIRVRYNDAVSAETVKPNFPPGAKIEKFDISKFMDGKNDPPEPDIDIDL